MTDAEKLAKRDADEKAARNIPVDPETARKMAERAAWRESALTEKKDK